MTERLTSLTAVKDWLGIDTGDSDAMLTRVIDAASQFVLNYTSHDGYAGRDYVQRFKGNGKSRLLTRNWPVLSVSTVSVGGTSLAASSWNNGLPTVGYSIADSLDVIELQGTSFYYGAPCQVSYRAGYETSQDFVLVSGQAVTPSAGGSWSTPVSVVKNGVAMTRVSQNPAAGQYTVDEWGSYGFAAADAGATVTIIYGYAPWDLSIAVTKLIGEWFAKKDRIGLMSKSLGGQETVSFFQGDMSADVATQLQQFVNVVPY